MIIMDILFWISVIIVSYNLNKELHRPIRGSGLWNDE
jgi:hypothetical protein